MNEVNLVWRVIDIVKNHNKWRRLETINLIPSENVMSPLAEYLYLNDMMSRYAEGTIRNRFYQGAKYIDELEELTVQLMCKLFNSKHCDIRPVSGTIANLATMCALCRDNDLVMAIPLSAGAHISHREVGGVKVLRLRIMDLPWRNDEFNVDIDYAAKLIREHRPKIVILGGSVYLFPHPVKEIASIVHEVNGYVIHDSAHVLGLIAGKVFPNPLDQGADIMTTSTHKTFPGPQGGAVLTNSEELFRKIQKAIFPTFTSNYHQHRYAALAITSLEMILFGEEYAEQIVKNAKRLAEALYNYGLKVLAENKGFTTTHQVLIDVSNQGGGAKNALLLEKANIIVNKNLLPWDKDPVNPSGIRIGVQEITRLGMKEHDMEEIAKFISDVILKRKNPEEVKKKVVEFRREFTEVKYGFDLKSFNLENAVKLLI